MKKLPDGWPRICPALFYDDAGKAIDWLVRAFGFEVRLKIEGDDGDVAHSELVFGDGLIFVGSTKRREGRKSPRAIDGANTQALGVYVDDVDAHCKRARDAGAKILQELKDVDYGADHWSDRCYEVADLEGHRWWFATRLRG